MMNMNRWMLLLTLAVASHSAIGGFTEPAAAQIEKAANDASVVKDIVKDASPGQAAAVIKNVVVVITGSDMSTSDKANHIAAVITQVFQLYRGRESDLALALGRAVAASPGASMTADIISAIQRAVVTAGGVPAGRAFGNSYMLAMQSVAGAPGGGKTVPPVPPPPPVATPYKGQPFP